MNTELIDIITAGIFFLGLYGLIVSRNMIKSIIFITVMQAAVIMFFISLGYHTGIMPPIGEYLDYAAIADPLPQALMITAIIIGMAVTAVNLTMLITLFRKYKTTDWVVASRKEME